MLHIAATGVYEKRSPLHDDLVHSRHWLLFEDVCRWCTLAVCVSSSVAALAVAPVVLSLVCAHVCMSPPFWLASRALMPARSLSAGSLAGPFVIYVPPLPTLSCAVGTDMGALCVFCARQFCGPTCIHSIPPVCGLVKAWVPGRQNMGAG